MMALPAPILLALYPLWRQSNGQDANYDSPNHHLYAPLPFLACVYAGIQTFLSIHTPLHLWVNGQGPGPHSTLP